MSEDAIVVKVSGTAVYKAVKNYPYKEISEYTRVDLDLDEFVRYGAWEPWDDN